MTRYNEYRDSGVKWIGEIPSHWEVKPFGRYFIFGKGLPITKADLCLNGIAVISYGQIHAKNNSGISISDDLVRFVSENYLKTHPQCLLNKQDFVFADTSEDIEGSGNFAYNDRNTPLFAGYHTIIARPRKLACTKYYALLFQSKKWKAQIQSLVNGVKVYSIRKRLLKKSILLIPPYQEQQAIVDYLQEKTQKIDKYIAERQQEITLFEQLKQAEIANVVTKGLNPNVPMKDSGIPWIGVIPSHWEAEKINHHFAQRVEKCSDKDYPPLSVSKQGVTPQLDTAVKTDNGENRKLVCTGDFVVNSRSDRKGSCGVSNYDGSVSLINIVIKPRDVNPLYYHYLFRSNDYIEEFYRLGRGIVADLWTTRYSEMRNIYIPIPPYQEQQAIADYIDNRLAKIDQHIAGLTAEIEYLKEFKQRLISDAVTGQIKVVV